MTQYYFIAFLEDYSASPQEEDYGWMQPHL